MLIAGCNNVNRNEKDENSGLVMEQLFKVDVQKVNLEGSNGSYATITNKENLDILGKAFGQIVWHQSIEPVMVRKEDLRASLYYDFDKDLDPKKLVEYAIWFNTDETASIMMRDGGMYGILDKEHAQSLKEILSSK